VLTSKETDQVELRELRNEQTQLISLLTNFEGTWETKLQRLARIFERRIELGDPEFNFPISEISTEITKDFRKRGIKIAEHVSDYLDDKYKNKSQARYGPVTGGHQAEYNQTRQALEYLSSNQALVMQVLEDEGKTNHSLIQSSYALFHNGELKTERIANDEGIALEDHTTKKEHRTPTPPSEITEPWQAYGWLIDGLKKTQQFLYKFPPAPERSAKFTAGILELGKLLLLDNEKYSLWRIMWLTKVKYMVHHSKHGAAVKDKVMTMLCENCYDIKTGLEKPDTNAEMVKDPTSPTHWRCGSCRGIVGHWRELTREQCGDNKQPYITQAEAFCNTISYFIEGIEYYSEDYMPYNGARKIDLGIELSDLS